MFAGLGSLLAEWLSREPAAGLMVLAAAVMLFGTVFIRLRSESRFRLAFVVPLYLGIIHALVFIGITGTGYVLLDSSYKAFKPLATSLAQGEEFEKELENARQKWGARVHQLDLAVTHTTSHVEVVEVPGENDKVLYINQTVVDPVEQESITRFNGLVDIQMVDPRLSTYILNARYEYDVVNQSDQETIATFQFPVGKDRIFRNVSVTMDGQDIGSRKRIQEEVLIWEQTMQPGQKITLIISFVTQGMEVYVFVIPENKPIQDFSLIVNVDSPNMYSYTLPEDSTAIVSDQKRAGNGYRTSWRIKNSILAPNVGVVLQQTVKTDINQGRMIRIFEYMPRGLMLLMVVVVFTMLICSIPVDLWRLALLAALFSANFLLFMGLDLLQIDHPIFLLVLARPVLVILSAIYQKLPCLPLRLLIFSTTLFLLGYPYAGLLSEGPARIAFDSLVQALMILYIFVLAFYVRVRGASPEA